MEDIDAFVNNDRGVTLEVGGQMKLDNITDRVPLEAVDLSIHLVSTRTDAIRPMVTDALPEIGSVDAKGRLVGPVNRLALEDFVSIRGGSGPVRVESRGRIGWIPIEDDKPVSDMDINMSIQAEQSTILSSFYEVPVQEIGAVSISGRIVGATNRFQLKKVEFSSKNSQGLEMKMSGGIDFAEQQDGNLKGDVKFKLEIAAPNMGAAVPLILQQHTSLIPAGSAQLLAGSPGNMASIWALCAAQAGTAASPKEISWLTLRRESRRQQWRLKPA